MLTHCISTSEHSSNHSLSSVQFSVALEAYRGLLLLLLKNAKKYCIQQQTLSVVLIFHWKPFIYTSASAYKSNILVPTIAIVVWQVATLKSHICYLCTWSKYRELSSSIELYCSAYFCILFPFPLQCLNSRLP